MPDIADPLPELDALIARWRAWRGHPLAIATVIDTWGSAPRPRGSHMLVHADGRFEGSVSGGCVEGEVLHAATEAIADGRSRRLDFSVGDDAAWEVSLPCGGAISVFVQPLSDDAFPEQALEALADARERGCELALTTDLGSGQTVIADQPGDDRFVNHYRPARRLLIVGAVQIAQALAGFARALDIQPMLIDPRTRFLTEERFPGLPKDDRWPDDAIRALAPDRSTAIVTLSHDPKIDDPALLAALASPAGYIAALGSKRSHAARIERLRAVGVTEEQLTRIDAPAGIDIGALGPAEIALSIAAGLIRAIRRS